MRAGTWAGLGVLFLLATCVFPPALLVALVCFIGMVIAMQVKPPQVMAGIQTPQGLVQTSTTAHWSSFERMTGEFDGVFRVATLKGEAEALSNKLRIGETLRVVPGRTKNERGVTIDSFTVTDEAGGLVGKLPAQIEAKYVEAMKTSGAAFTARVHHVATGQGEPAILAEFKRCDMGYLDAVRRKQFWQANGVAIVVGVIILSLLLAIGIAQHYNG